MRPQNAFKTGNLEPAFKVGDLVREQSQLANINRDKGVVTSYYEYNGQYRYLVTFDNGMERLLFERELMHVSEMGPSKDGPTRHSH